MENWCGKGSVGEKIREGEEEETEEESKHGGKRKRDRHNEDNRRRNWDGKKRMGG